MFKLFKDFKDFSWNDYYGNTNIDKLYENKKFNSKHESLHINSSNTYVYNCYFFQLTASSGGAILYSLSESYLLVEKSIIENCTVKQNSAGIGVTAGNCVIAFVCGKYEYAGHSDGFCSICYDNARKINHVFDSSISNCEANKSHIMYHSFGDFYAKSLNLSNNNASDVSGIQSIPS